jgi:hypothetical protein
MNTNQGCCSNSSRYSRVRTLEAENWLLDPSRRPFATCAAFAWVQTLQNENPGPDQ